MTSEQTTTAASSGGTFRASIQTLLEEDLDDQELAARLRALLPPAEVTDGPPTTDEATDHPGYQ